MKISTLFLALALALNATAQDGTLDLSFNAAAGAGSNVHGIAEQADGKILINRSSVVSRLNADGSADASFNGPTAGSVYHFSLQPDGKLVIGGSFSTVNGTPRNNIARLNADGSLDTSFDPGNGADGSVWTTAITPDGKIMIGGMFDNINGVSRNGIARLNADGSLDATFDPGLGTSVPSNADVSDVCLQPDGKMIIVGSFEQYNGTPRNSIARLNADGSLDTSFDPGNGILTGLGFFVSRAVLQPDGKVLVTGKFNSYNGVARKNIARANSDGSLDTTFNPGTGTTNSIFDIALQPDGKIILGGLFTAYNGTTVNNVTRILADGSAVDPDFVTGTGANARLESVVLLSDGKVMIGGEFSDYNGTPRNLMARLLNGNATGIDVNDKKQFAIFPNPTNALVTVRLDDRAHTRLDVFDAIGRLRESRELIGEETNIDFSGYDNGIYFLRMFNGRDDAMTKVVKQ